MSLSNPAVPRTCRCKHYLLLWCLLPSVLPTDCARTLEDERALIGWKGDTYNPKSVFAKSPANVSRSIQISAKPLAFIQHDLLTEEEARHLVELAAPRMKRSMVGGNNAITEVRTSYGMFIPRYQDEIVARLEERVAKWTGIPVSHQEDIQVLRYAEGQQYRPHMDSNGRICTVLIYLTDTAAGGETAFPKTHKSNWLDPALDAAQTPRSECATGHVAVKPKRGLGLLFWSMPPDALYDPSQRRVDPYSEHTGCPPTSGYKWTLTIWIHYEPFRPEEFTTIFKKAMPDPALCADYHDSCKIWSARGECEKNAAYMVGSAGSMGNCRKSCGVCDDCPPGDTKCLEDSRVKQGYLPELEKEMLLLFNGSANADARASDQIAPVRVAVRPAQARRMVLVRADPAELKTKVAEAIKGAEDACKEGTTGECAAAWDEVEELSAAASHLKDQQQPEDPLEKFCESDPSADECRVYED